MKKYLIAVLVLAIAIFVPVYAETSAVFIVEPSLNDGTATVTVSYTGNLTMYGGNFDIIYDNEKLQYESAEVGTSVKTALTVLNEKLADNTIRFVWASEDLLPESGEIIVLKFALSGAFENSDLKVNNFEICNMNGQTIKDAAMSVKDVAGSTIYSGAVIEENSGNDTKAETTTKEEEKASSPDTEKNSSLVAGGSGSSNTLNDAATDATLPLDKVPSEEEAALGFIDVTEADWFFESIKYVKENQLMSGVSETEFAPNASLTRAMLVVILYRIEGEPQSGTAKFDDVENGTWYTNAVSWAASEGIVDGIGDNKFAPNTEITREQIATILYKYSQKKGTVEAASVAVIAPDTDEISDWAKEGMFWAVSQKLITGTDGGRLDPGGKATRAEIATILMRYLKNK